MDDMIDALAAAARACPYFDTLRIRGDQAVQIDLALCHARL
jgi:hypothetical protein